MSERHWSSGSERRTLGLMYLLLSAENRINDADFALFEELGKSIDHFPHLKGEIIGDCEKILGTPHGNKTRFEIIAEIFSVENSSVEKDNIPVLWALINTLYQSETRSEKKQELIDIWIQNSNVTSSIAMEIQDIFETQKAILGYRKYLESSNATYQEINPIMQELERSQESLRVSMGYLISLE